jgi:hypothetical protein
MTVATLEQNQWIERVLGFHFAPKSVGQDILELVDTATLAALTDKAGKLATASRPAGPQKLQATNQLLSAIAGKPAPPDPLDAPDHVATFVPGFLMAVEQERPTTSQQLSVGEKLSGQDHMLGIADLFAAVQRSLIEWEEALTEAKTEDRSVDKLEKESEKRDEGTYIDTLASYNASRIEGLQAEGRALPLLQALQAKFNSLSEEQQAAALQEVSNA